MYTRSPATGHTPCGTGPPRAARPPTARTPPGAFCYLGTAARGTGAAHAGRGARERRQGRP
nr:MAG TPA: hypothetical protein [Caudoviricetes sp.]